MAGVGFSEAGVERFRLGLRAHVESRQVPGLVALVERDGEQHVEIAGHIGLDSDTPMTRDSIFRIASITKPVAAAAAMILVEECRIRLDDSIDPWLPELANRRVLTSWSSLDETVSAKRSISLRDLLTSCMGFGSIMTAPDTYPIQKLIRELRIGGDGPPLLSANFTMDEWLKNLGSLPWLAQPGEKWMYHVSIDVLGALIQRVSGQRFGAFLQDRIFDPLGMKDTGFSVPADKMHRLAHMYTRNRQTDKLEHYDDPAKSAWSVPPTFESAGGGLVSTVDDYYAFTRMLLDRGSFRKRRILSPASVALMTSDQVSPQQRAGSELFFGDYSSWAFGMAVDTGRREIYHSPGRFGWTGGYGTTAYVDPKNRMIGVFFSQRMMESPEPPRVFTDFWNLAYAAME
ncbi:serine hydrolase domain-containing protein [Silvibacterium acidisoli]|uniref:serine hydrolase domain-containing protein n=1 Tax=Acidobacteriaceae bacterium ZG23-2 TaxID=2883246 RepID=UPI00406C90C5